MKIKIIRFFLRFLGLSFLLIIPYVEARLLLTKLGLLEGKIEDLATVNALIIVLVSFCFAALELLNREQMEEK